jgi:poly(A) polymerase
MDTGVGMKTTINCTQLTAALSSMHGLECLQKWLERCTNANIEPHLVGGCLRDAALFVSKPQIDLDFIIQPFEKTKMATQYLSDLFDSHFFPLDEERSIYRIHTGALQCDINGMRGKEIIDDIFQRDFSMNSLYVPLSEFLHYAPLNAAQIPVIDLFQGYSDLIHKNIRAHNPATFQEDPLRILRAYRIASQIEGTIDPATYQLMIDSKQDLHQCAQERIREEFIKIASHEKSHHYIFAMEEAGIFSQIFPFFEWFVEVDQCYTSWLQLKDHVKAGLYYLEGIFQRIHQGDFPYARELQSILKTPLAGDCTVEVSMKIAILLHDIGKPDTLRLMKDRLRFFEHENVGVKAAKEYLHSMHFSSKEVRFIADCIQWHMRPHNLSSVENLSKRAQYRFFRDTSPNSIPILLIALADAYATRMVPLQELPQYEDFIKNMLQYIFTPGIYQQTPLLDGHAIMAITGLSPGKQVGDLQKKILEEQGVGNITSKQEAEEWIKKN